MMTQLSTQSPWEQFCDTKRMCLDDKMVEALHAPQGLTVKDQFGKHHEISFEVAGKAHVFSVKMLSGMTSHLWVFKTSESTTQVHYMSAKSHHAKKNVTEVVEKWTKTQTPKREPYFFEEVLANRAAVFYMQENKPLN